MRMRQTQRSDHLPEEIMEEILLRVDVKSLLRYRCVSKSYRSLIGSKRFIKLHLQRSTRDTTLAHHRVLFFNDKRSPKPKVSGCSLVSFLDPSSYKEAADLELNSPEAQALLSFIDPSSYQAASELNFPLLSCIGSSSFETAPQLNFPANIPPYNAISYLGCCNGLVCIILHNKEIGSRFMLWNPSTRISKEVPCIDKSMIANCYGFGWDESTDDYKIVAIVKFEGQSETAQIYSLKSDSWKQNDGLDGLSRSWSLWKVEGVFTFGKLYWECYDRAKIPNEWELVAFDLKREVFQMIEQPFSCGHDSYLNLGTFGECLAVQRTCDDYEYKEIWVMKEFGVKESWEKVMVLDDYLYDKCGIRTCPSYNGNGNGGKGKENGGEFIFMNIAYNVTYLAYNEEKKRLHYASTFKDFNTDFETDIHSQIYVESLVSPVRVD